MTIEARFDDLTVEQQGIFPDEIDFSDPITLTLGLRAVWDADAESVEVVHGFPKRDWKKLTRDQRESLPVEWMPQGRDADSMLRFGVRRNLMSKLLEGLSMDESLEKAADSIAAARTQLSKDGALAGLLSDVRAGLVRLAPVSADHTLSIGTTEATRDELLKNLELFLSHHGDPVALGRQSSGLGQLAGFAFMMRLVETRPGRFS